MPASSPGPASGRCCATGSSASSRPTTTTTSTSDRPAVDLKAAIRERAHALGFDRCGFTRAALPERISRDYLSAIEDGRHGTMDWLARDPERRSTPRGLWHEARTVIALAMTYGPEEDPRPLLARRDRANISVYARGEDYHDVIKPRLKQIGRWLAEDHGAGIKVFVDTAPVLEKPLAQQAGLGWQGKHSNLVSRDLGSWFFLAEIYTDLDLEPDPPERDHCGRCRACLDVCPTRAFVGPYRLDARRCLSYLTIEHKGPIPAEFRAAMGNRIYGCDDCLAACPWNKFARTAQDAKLRARDDLKAPGLAELAGLDDQAFRALFRKSPIKRIGRDRFLRNVLIAIGNSREVKLLPCVEKCLTDPSPLVRGMAVWALERLASPQHVRNLADRHATTESNAHVHLEWSMATGGQYPMNGR
ncbi:tRNA epoxyqueuosine(34) reductase QueG [Marinivivus vitaminiproducens]|uniref:tRNA epoxyqueuosine(34) reductase QueG n=1 Tax=Marinivivus vitaminiproducens TaxID=3035935 RepID=UPI00279DB309|nr:tRNA epoxyqueuosine(34) reductase QueG [Geminicoccaceae bacterium SCSIO 64248]